MTRSQQLKPSVFSMLALLILAASLLLPSSAKAQALAFGQVFNGQSPRCLDSGTPTDTAMFNCSGSIYQVWTWTVTGQIIGNSPAGCLDGGNGQNGTLVAMVPCTGSQSQRWYWDFNHWLGTMRIINQASGRCLDADLATINHNGTKVQLMDCTNGANQKWVFTSVYTT